MPLASSSPAATKAPLVLELEEHPFALLGLTPRDGNQKILEAAEEKSATLDPAVCAKARSALTMPRERIAAEIAWLPGLSPTSVRTALSLLQLAPVMILDRTGDPPLAFANLVAGLIDRLDSAASVEDWARRICKLADAAGGIQAEDVLRDLNEDRIAARIPQIGGLNAVEEQIACRKQIYRDRVMRGLGRLPASKLVEVVTATVDRSTQSGTKHAPSLIDDIVAGYELEAGKYLLQEAENVATVIAAVQKAAAEKSSGLGEILNLLDEVVRRWDRLAQPIQLSLKSRGMGHEMSRDVAVPLRNLSVDLVNDHGELEAASRVLAMLKEVFAESPELVHRFDDDMQALNNLFEQKARNEKEDEDWRGAIQFSAEIGALVKNTLSISAGGISWKNQLFPLDSIKRVRWGATRHSLNGIPTGTTYHIWFGDARSYASVETRQEPIFQSFTEKLWQAVCVRLVFEFITSVAKGEHIPFSDAIIHDSGVILKRRRLFSSDEQVPVSWGDLRIWNQDGCFYLGSANDKKVYAALSYQNIDNVHILEAVIRTFFKKGGASLSKAFLSD
jgi:hypothetical protein